MWQRFTERARKVIFYAQEEAGRLGDRDMATEHLLLGLTREPDSAAARILDRIGVPMTAIRSEIEGQVTRSDVRLGQDMQLTPRAKHVIDLAYDEARLLNDTYIGTEHLLLGLIREGEGLAGKALKDLDVTLDRARRGLNELKSGEPAPANSQSIDAETDTAFAFPDSIAKLFVPRELYDAIHELAEIQRQLSVLPETNQYEHAYALQRRRYELHEKIDSLVEAQKHKQRGEHD